MRRWERRIACAAPDSRGSDAAPQTVNDALRSPMSPTVNAIYGRAAAEAASDSSGMVGLRHLLLGALQLGEAEVTQGAAAPQFATAFMRAVRAASPLADFGDRFRGADVTGGFDLPLSPMAQAAITQARLFARLASGEDFLAARHLIMALTFPLRPGLRAATRRVWRTRWQLDPEALRPALIEAMEREIAARQGNGREEDRAAWQSLFGTRRDTPAFAPDAAQPARVDPLGHAEDARRMAELACLKANEPPMAIALFGDWGSGKSTFMRRMQEAVEDIAATWRGDANAPFCTQVAQLRFNAWTYADANLWASFAVAIFAGLRAEVSRIVGASQPSAYDDLMDAIAAANGRATAIDTAAAAAIDALDKDIAKTEAKIADASRRLQAGLEGEAMRKAQAQLVAKLGEQAKLAAATLSDMGIVVPAGGETDALLKEARWMQTRAGQLRTTLAVAWSLRRRPDVLFWVALVLAALAASLYWNAGAALLAAIPALPLVKRVVDGVAPLMEAAATIEKQAEEMRTALVAERRALEERLSALRAERAAKVAEQARARRNLARYAPGTEGASPATVLRFFLEETPSLREYDQQLGLVSRLQQSFKELSDIMRRQRAAFDAHLPRVDRIILYVDDLDRCRPAQVVQVLEALALLMQFDLFIAVVAVDGRWLEGALRAHYGDQLGGGGAATTADYLEKIFQIPFWLPLMRATELNRFGAFVAHLAPEAVGSGTDQTPPKEPDTGFVTTTGELTSAGLLEVDPDELPQPSDDDPFAQASKADTVARVSLTEDELGVLSGMAPLAGGTPRAVKRFVNLYRLLRASRQGSALDAFLGEKGADRPFVLVAFALAWQCGGDARLTPPFVSAGPEFDADERLAALRKAKVHEVFLARLQQSDQGVREKFDAQATDAKMALQMQDEDRTFGSVPVGIALSTMVQAFGREPTMADLAPAWAEASRFSFRRPPEA